MGLSTDLVANGEDVAAPAKEAGGADSVVAVAPPAPAPANQSTPPAAEDKGGPQVRLVGVKTDIARRYRWIVPPIPIPPFTDWKRWFQEHEISTHCALEWRDEQGQWRYGEMRSLKKHPLAYAVGFGEFPATAFISYAVFIVPGRVPRDIDDLGRPTEVVVDEEVKCDYRQVEAEFRNYANHDAHIGEPGTGGSGDHNVGLGGPAYKPAQNSNTMINYILKHCGINRPAPDLAVGWDRVPHFPFSSNADMPALDCCPYHAKW